ncbi:unnamed protein product [Gadus morhua 'NCC']
MRVATGRHGDTGGQPLDPRPRRPRAPRPTHLPLEPRRPPVSLRPGWDEIDCNRIQTFEIRKARQADKSPAKLERRGKGSSSNRAAAAAAERRTGRPLAGELIQPRALWEQRSNAQTLRRGGGGGGGVSVGSEGDWESRGLWR